MFLSRKLGKAGDDQATVEMTFPLRLSVRQKSVRLRKERVRGSPLIIVRVRGRRRRRRRTSGTAAVMEARQKAPRDAVVPRLRHLRRRARVASAADETIYASTLPFWSTELHEASTNRDSCNGNKNITEAVIAPCDDAKMRNRIKHGISSPNRSTHFIISHVSPPNSAP